MRVRIPPAAHLMEVIRPDEDAVLKTVACKGVGGSSPSASWCTVVQLVERPPVKRKVTGSNPVCAAILFPDRLEVGHLTLTQRRCGSNPTQGE